MDGGCDSGGGGMGGGGGGGGGCDFGGGGGGGFSSGGGDFGGGGGGFSSGGGGFSSGGGGFSSGGGDFGGGGGFTSSGGIDHGGNVFSAEGSHNNFGYNHGHNTIVHPTAGVGFVPGPHGGYAGTHYTTANTFGQPGSNVTVYGAQPTTVYQPGRPYNSAPCAKSMLILFIVFCVVFVLLAIMVPIIVVTTTFR